MKAYQYGSWDDTQERFSLDVRSALESLSNLMMEGLSAAEALEWMRQYGFDMAGREMRVMGLEEIQNALRDQMRELEERFNMDSAMSEPAQQLEEILEREEASLRQDHGFESSRMNDFQNRRHHESTRVSDTLERFRDYEWNDPEAASDFAEMLAQIDEMRALEDFLENQGGRFRGPQAADYEEAQEIRQRMESLQRMMQDLASGNFQSISPEALGQLLGDDAEGSLILIQRLEDEMRDAGLLAREGAPELTPKAIRQMGAAALAGVYTMLKKGRRGEHETARRGVGLPRPDETRPWEFGDALDLDVVRTVINGVKRRAADGGAEPVSRVQLALEDFEVREMDYSSQTTTILLLDMSWSMSWAGRFPAAKRVAMAMDHLVRTRFPRDHFAVVGFSTRARELPIRELPEACWDMGDPFTNLQQGLMVAEDLIRKTPSVSPQILVITDGQPTAYLRDGELRVEWPMGIGGVSPNAVAETLSQVRRITRQGITINTFMLDDAPELVGFVERMTQINRGRAFYTQPSQLGSFLMVDYVAQRKRRI